MSLSSILLFTVNSIFPVILLILLGYFLKRINFYTKDFLKTANKMVFKLCLPVLLFKNITDISSLSLIPWNAVLYMLAIILVLVFAGLLATTLVKDPNQKGVIHQCIFRSNFALIGIPMAELIGGSEGVMAAAIISLFSIPIYNIFAVIVLSVYKKDENGTKISSKKIITDIAKNPLILGILAGLVVVLFRTVFPANPFSHLVANATFLTTAISYISRTATPLALIVLGGQFDFSRVAGYKKQLLIGVIGRTILAPTIGVGIAAILTLSKVVVFSPAVFAAFIALFGTPVAVSSAVMAEAMDNDGQLAAQLVVWTSLISVFTLFILVFLVKLAGLI